MAKAIQALEGRTVHQIQSGQVIVDLCSVVKELVENSLDAGAASIEVRFKNHGLDSIEVQDNGIGISSDNFETVALKHFTSKLISYDDLASLETFGFRGEALSSLCALSTLRIITAQADQAPKGTRLEYETSGELKKAAVTASQKGTTVIVEDLFLSLPVRRKELEKNIKREYGKVLNLLQAYACISTNSRVSVTNLLAKSKRVVVFATQSNSTTRENIAQIFGIKALHILTTMDLQLDLRSTNNVSAGTDATGVRILGHVSRPVVGEGRNAPDRQMFFVNGRPCNLPQIAKVFNEVYKSYNVSQNPFIFADFTLNTNSYDVNVSPDKRTIMLHDQNILLESLRESLTKMFEEEDQKIPYVQKSTSKLPTFKKISVMQGNTKKGDDLAPQQTFTLGASTKSKLVSDDEDHGVADSEKRLSTLRSGGESSSTTTKLSNANNSSIQIIERSQSLSEDEPDSINSNDLTQFNATEHPKRTTAIEDFNERLNEQQTNKSSTTSLEAQDKPNLLQQDFGARKSSLPPPQFSGVVPNAFDRMRPRRQSPQTAIVSVASKTKPTVLRGSNQERSMNDSYSSASSMEAGSSQSERPHDEKSQNGQFPSVPRSRAERVVEAKQINSDFEDEDSPSQDNSAISSHAGEGGYDNGLQTGTMEEEPDDREQLSQPSTADLEDYFDENEKKAQEDAKVAELIKNAEKVDVCPNSDKKQRAIHLLQGAKGKDSTTGLVQTIDVSLERVGQEISSLQSMLSSLFWHTSSVPAQGTPKEPEPFDERLTLTISKSDFYNMHVIGQFNLGFVLATRNGTDLLIIDQHASDEKYNFERLQKKTVVQNQRLVQPRRLELTAFDEEVILDNDDALLKNGFQVEIDQSGLKPVGQRCELVSLPMSKEVTFGLSDLEELVALLAESSPADFSDHVPRPSKVRRLFAMRACRSSIMIGRTLTMTQMQGLLRHMSEIDRPWNCPHGRPTMRYVCGLSDWIEWKECSGVKGLEDEESGLVDWAGLIQIAMKTGTSKVTEEVDDSRDGSVEIAGIPDEM